MMALINRCTVNQPKVKLLNTASQGLKNPRANLKVRSCSFVGGRSNGDLSLNCRNHSIQMAHFFSFSFTLLSYPNLTTTMNSV